MSAQYTLFELLKEYEVRIPIIQRDYVQGRSDEKGNEVRKKLILDIKNSLTNVEKGIDFNFVYGTKKEKIFFPVDGQQRLTTLYLLHWYLACFDDEALKEFNANYAFSYKTRNSATEFFSVLHQPPIGLKEIVRNAKTELRREVTNQAWFQAEWAYDPTVDAALTFLNDLSADEDFRNNENQYYKRLRDEKLFYFTVIIEEGEHAETKAAKSYIRMNARGKVLEQFENVKAMLDSIEEKIYKVEDELEEKKIYKVEDELEEKKSFIYNYDTSYINQLFIDASGKSLKDKTESINQKSMSYLITLYLLLKQWENCSSRIECARTRFVSEIYECSYNDDDKYRDFFEKYFRLLTAIFEYYQNKDKEIVRRFFEQEETVRLNIRTERDMAAIAMYLYYYYTIQEQTLEKVQMMKFLYVLENLDYRKWSENHFIEILDKVAKFVATKKDILDCFITEDDVSVMQEALKKSELSDYQVRIKEQSIKARLCQEQELAWDFFQELEGRGRERKIQYLFFISDYWKDYSKGDYDKLIKYKKIAEDYFLKDNKELNWRKHYAVAVHTRNDNLLSVEEINELYTEENSKYHIWKDDFYFWTDEEEHTSWSTALPYIEWIYEQLVAGKNIESTVIDNDYDKCWLYHALKGQQKELLTIELRWDATEGIVYALDDYKKGHRYDLYIKHIDKNNTMRYGIKDFVLQSKETFTFYANRTYEGFGVITKYQNYNITLNWSSKIVDLYQEEQAEQCGYYESKDENGKKVFIVLEAKVPYMIVEKRFDITDEWKEMQKLYAEVKSKVEKYTDSDWFKIKNDEHEDGWTRPNGNYHTWSYRDMIVHYRKDEVEQ